MQLTISQLTKILLPIILIIFTSCNNSSSEPETTLEFTERYSNEIIFPKNISIVVISNSIGFINVTGASDSSKINYTIDKTVTAESSALSEAELNKIFLDSSQIGDSLFLNIAFSPNINEFRKANISLNIPYSSNVIINSPNQGSYVSYLNSDLIINNDFGKTNIFSHTGSLEVKSIDGDVNVTAAILPNGFCNIYTEAGNVSIKIPKITSAIIELKSTEGSITYKNLDFLPNLETSNHITGTLNEGEAIIKIISLSGNITLEGFE
jgi:hypothetical protein